MDRPLQVLPLHDMLSASRTPAELGKLLHDELPVRFARRIRHIERIPDWEQIPELVQLRQMHLKSFRELRLADPKLDTYAGVIARIRHRHKNIGPLFADALQRIDAVLLSAESDSNSCSSVSSVSSINDVGASDQQLKLTRATVEAWAEAFLNSRVSTEMQMAQYAGILGSNPNEQSASKIGIVDMECDPVDICQQAIAQVQDGLYPCLVEMENPVGQIRFCQSPRYLFYIVVELLNNAARATAEACDDEPAEVIARPIKVSVCADESQVVIRISDRGGGMPSQVAQGLWSYVSRVGAHSSKRAPDASPAGLGTDIDSIDEALLESPAGPPTTFVERPWAVFTGSSPLSGRGIGLPLSRLYAKYLGGSLEVVNLPGLGVDSFLFLPRIDPDQASSGVAPRLQSLR